MYAYVLSAAAIASAATAAYQSMAPSGQWYGKTFTRARGSSKKLALTYDDGPNDPYTLQLMDVLAKHGVHATFFTIGRYVQQRPQIVRDLVQAGHVVGNHTYTHPNLALQSETQVRIQLSTCQNVLSEVTGAAPKLFRPPYGGRRPVVLRVARELGLEPIMWSITCYDWKATTPEQVERHAHRQFHGGAVILLHDGRHVEMGTDRSHTVKATDHLISKYKAEGYEFVTIPEMLA